MGMMYIFVMQPWGNDMQMSHRFELGTLAVLVALSLAGCGEKGSGKESQVAAKVNGDELTVHQLNFELAKLGNLSQDQAKQAANQVLKSMVDEQLLVQKAVADKLDREPQVVQALDAARRQILAQSLLQSLIAGQAKPSDAEIVDYYGKNPALFSDRRIYRLEEINVQVTPASLTTVKAQLQKTTNLGDFGLWLKEQKIPARGGQVTKAAEQLPLELLPHLMKMKNGQTFIFTSPGTLTIVALIDSESQAMTQEQARPMIERFLVNAKKREVAEAELKKLKAKAKIEYLGDYAKSAEVAAPAPASAKEAPAPTANGNEKAMEKGMSGLK